jgi:hypothetical protein
VTNSAKKENDKTGTVKAGLCISYETVNRLVSTSLQLLFITVVMVVVVVMTTTPTPRRI